MRMSDEGIVMLKALEGLRLRAYDDMSGRNVNPGDEVQGTLTIGYGHTRTAEAGTEITPEYAEELLREDIRTFEEGVGSLLHNNMQGTTQSQFDALVSFAFNVGLSALGKSTLLRKHLAGDTAGASNEFGRWVYASGQFFGGLVARRTTERHRYLDSA